MDLWRRWRALCAHGRDQRRKLRRGGGPSLPQSSFPHGRGQRLAGDPLLTPARPRPARLAVGHFRTRAARAAFLEWRQWCFFAHRERTRGVVESLCAAAARAEAEKGAARAAQLEAEVAALRAALQREATARMALESDARAAFMRSVCALNLEAAGLLKQQMVPGAAGMSPGGAGAHHAGGR